MLSSLLSTLPYKCHFVIITVILQIIWFKLDSKNELNRIHPDTRSALERARTETCRNEILLTSQLLHGSANVHLKRLVRTCHHDLSGPSFSPVGCMMNSSKYTVKLEHPIVVKDLTLCLDLCFSYGHSHGGMDQSTGKCHCGGDEGSQLSSCNNKYSDSFDWFRLNSGIHSQFSVHKIRSKSESPRRNVNIAFLLSLNGRSVIQIQRLLRAIYNENHLYYIHVDKRRDYLYRELLPLQEKFSNIIITSSRFSTIWGSPSLLSMILDTIRNISNRKWNYLINLSESDFPLKSLRELEHYLASHSNDIFLKTHNMKGYSFIKKQGLDRTFYQCDNHVWRLGERILPLGVIYSGGSDWFALPRDFCDYITNELEAATKFEDDSQKNFVATLLDVFNHTLLPAESFFHTIAINSKFCDRFRDENLRLTNWQRKQGCKCQHSDVVDWCGCSPMIYRSNDWNRLEKTLLNSNLFFSRKFDPTISMSIINRVENQLVKKVPVENQINDTRYWLNVYHSEDSTRDNNTDNYNEFSSMSLRVSKLDYWLGSLKSVDLYFKQDRFAGYVLQFCRQTRCMQSLLERNITAHLKDYDHKCLSVNERRLQAIEVNHDFDTSERAFRDISPLHQWSNVVVYHEWLVQKTPATRSNFTKVKFIWYDPSGKIQLTQDANLKLNEKLTRLSLAHRLSIRKPIESGLWTLVIGVGRLKCLSYEFFVMGKAVLSGQHHFSKFYTMSKSCEHDLNMARSKSFNFPEWSLFARQERLAELEFK